MSKYLTVMCHDIYTFLLNSMAKRGVCVCVCVCVEREKAILQIKQIGHNTKNPLI